MLFIGYIAKLTFLGGKNIRILGCLHTFIKVIWIGLKYCCLNLRTFFPPGNGKCKLNPLRELSRIFLKAVPITCHLLYTGPI